MPHSPTESQASRAQAEPRAGLPRLPAWALRLCRPLLAALAEAYPEPPRAVNQPPTAAAPRMNSERLAPHPPLASAISAPAVASAEPARAATEQREKHAFLANISHELRTPLHAVLSYAQLGLDAQSQSEQRDYFERIIERGRALLSVLSDLLDLSQLEAGSMSMEFAPHDLEALVRDVLHSAEPMLREKQLRSELRCMPGWVHGRAIVDAVRVSELLLELLENATRFAPAGSCLRVQLSRTTLTAAAQGGPSERRPALEIAISDEGIGIPEGELDAIFEKFAQSSEARADAGGLGLGLAICRAIVALHGGAIWATNNATRGATLHVALPLAIGAHLGRGLS